MKNKSTILLKTWPWDSDIHKPETIIQLETFKLDDSEGRTMDHTKFWSISKILSCNLTEQGKPSIILMIHNCTTLFSNQCHSFTVLFESSNSGIIVHAV